MLLKKPQSSASIFRTGKINVTGARNEHDAWIAGRKYARKMQNLDYPVQFKNFRITNVVGSVDVGFPIQLKALESKHKKCATHNLDVQGFPGLQYYMSDPELSIRIFDSGKVNFTGAKSMDEINRGFLKLWPILTEF